MNDIASGANGVQAALANYDTEDYSTAGMIASENLKKPKIIQALEEALPDELLNEVHREGLLAVGIADVPDYSVRAKYLDMAYKRKGLYAAEKHVNLNVEVEADDTVKELTQKLNELHRNSSK